MALSPHVFDATAENFQRLVLESLPAELRKQDDLAHLHAHFSMAHAAQTALTNTEPPEGDPNDPMVLFQQAATQLANDQIESALDLLIEIDRDHPQYRSGLPRQAILALFEMLGSEHPLTKTYRSRLAQG